jgi:hypothetical protein
VNEQILDIKVEFSKVRDLYKQSPRKRKGNFLVLGEKGAGKTSLLRTCPKPVLVHSFDPGGTEVLNDLIDKGEILVDNRFEKDERGNPVAYNLWEGEFNRLGRIGFFSHIGTYAIDSLTTYATSALWQIMRKEGRTPPGMQGKSSFGEKGGIHGMRIQDWGTFLDHFINLTRSLTSLPCHTVLLGHVEKVQDEVTGNYLNTVMIQGRSKEHVPINMNELYIMQCRETSKGLEHYLLTRNDGSYRATTRMGARDLFDKEEMPDIKKLLKKAGYPCEDKPLLT